MSSKYMLIAEKLKEEIARRASMDVDRLPPEMELVKQYGVSRQTIRQALSVLQAEGLVEKRRGSGTYIAGTLFARAAASKTIAVITPFTNDNTFPAALWDMQSVFASFGYHQRVYSTKNSVQTEREILMSLSEDPVHGILVQGTLTAFPNPNLDLYRQLEAGGTSILFWSCGYPELERIPCLCSDDYAGGYMLARHLIGEGHSRIAGIFRSDDLTGHRRYLGCICALRDSGIPFPDDRFFWYDIRQRNTVSEPLNMRALLPFIQTRLPECSAVICQDDETAYFLIRELLRQNIRVPAQISVVGFGDSYFSETCPVKITTLSHGPTKLWTQAAQGILLLMDHKPFPAMPLSWTLQKKDSDCPAAY